MSIAESVASSKRKDAAAFGRGRDTWTSMSSDPATSIADDADDDTLAALRDALTERGCDTSGTFVELEQRLVDAIAAEAEDKEAAAVNVDSMSIKELKELITKARMSFADCIDKADLRKRATEAAAALADAQANYKPMFAEAAEARAEAPAAARDCPSPRRASRRPPASWRRWR